MKRVGVLVVSLLVLLFVSASANATSFLINVSLDGPQASVASPGTGFATMTLDDVANTLSVNLSFTGLLAPTTNAHIHCCSVPPLNSGVVIPFVPPFPLGVTSGSMVNVFSISALNVTQVKSGLAYINIHTSFAPGGEIRGNIAAIPEPTSLALVSLGLLGLGVARRRSASR